MAKKIILLADGTGNGMLVQISNICRLSGALDMSSKDQLVFYIPGVGTEEFKPLALLDGATGLGVPANVRKLYRFLSWNWTEDAAIYMFGFSRGAFTIRMLVDLIAKEGILPTEVDNRRVSHQEMIRNSEDAWRAFCDKDPERKKNIWFMLRLPRLRDAIFGVWKKLRGQPSYAAVMASDPKRRPNELSIDFVGLFDTVEAYGVPIEEMREGIHRFAVPIKFGGDHTIWSNVRCVRQALSLDDERRTFHPIRVSLQPDDAESRIQEVWFAGVHSDVGGGYPDDMTAHCPLVWMIGEVKKAAKDPTRALAFHSSELDEFKRKASPFGPLHDSRAGTAVLYRYDPRQVTLADPQGNAYCRPTVHHTVVERLVDGCDAYAPLALGADTKTGAANGGGADVVMPDGSIARARTGPGYDVVKAADSVGKAAVAQRELAVAQGAMKSLDAPNPEEMEIARDYVWLNRTVYIAFVLLFIVVLALPLLNGTIDDLRDDIWNQVSMVAVPFEWLLNLLGPAGAAISRLASGVSNVLRGVGDTILTLTPSYLDAHVRTAVNHPGFTLMLVLAYFGLRHLGDAYQDAIRYHARQAWNITGDKPGTSKERQPGRLSQFARSLRNSTTAHVVLGVGKGLLPATYAVVFLFVPLLIAASRIGFNYLEGSGRVCVESNAAEWVANGAKPFRTSDPCWASGWLLERGGVYRLTISIDPKNDDPWLDQLMLTDPYGFDGKGWALGAGVVLRRWPSAAWFQPVARIGGRGDVEWPLAPSDGGGPLSARGRRCSRLPHNYGRTDEHKSFCVEHPTLKSCLHEDLSLRVADPLPRDELDAAKAAWARNSFEMGGGKSCSSPFPRKTFSTEFVARDTGELFLFVNDAAHVAWDGRAQMFYANNTGTATVTLERLPRAVAAATVSR